MEQSGTCCSGPCRPRAAHEAGETHQDGRKIPPHEFQVNGAAHGVGERDACHDAGGPAGEHEALREQENPLSAAIASRAAAAHQGVFYGSRGQPTPRRTSTTDDGWRKCVSIELVISAPAVLGLDFFFVPCEGLGRCGAFAASGGAFAGRCLGGAAGESVFQSNS